MHLVKEVLRLTAAGLSQRQIARSLHLSHGVVGKYQAAAQRVGLGWPLPEELDDGTLAARLGTKTDDNSGTQASARRAPPDFASVHEQQKLKGRHSSIQSATLYKARTVRMSYSTLRR